MTALPRGSGPPLTWKVSVPRGDRLGQSENLASGMQERLLRWPNSMSEAERYTLVVRARSGRYHPRPWSWEIFRDGEPLPARLRKDGYRTEIHRDSGPHDCLRSFLAGIADAESKS
jgi:hypothetical protein